ncbi:hypothetical protein CHELA20_53872 [Hyphomicrobiales bacterium]|nr:hypothetical protein CHELA41_21054 [Hyphomicrobiales bacterium]CAH1685118.1 hypothetical protein CHELA20_53872 [Hyphomicrobiales bacterium]
MISGIGGASIENLGKPAIGVDPGDGFAGGEIEDMRAAAEAVEARPRTGVGILEAPAAGETERRRAPLDELDDTRGIAGGIVAHPELRAAMLGLDRKEKAFRWRVFGGVLGGERVVDFERASGIVGRAHVEQAGKAGEIFGHDWLLKRRNPAHGRVEWMKERGGKSGGERQSQKRGDRLAPRRIDQPRFELAGAVAIFASRAVLAATGRGEGGATQFAGLGHDLAGLGVGCDRLLPEDNPGSDRSGEHEPLIAILNDHDARAKAQHVVGSGADVAACETAAGERHGLFGRRAFADDEDMVETIGFIAAVVAGGADAGDAQREFLCALQGRQDVAGENGADRGDAGLAGKDHGIHSATVGGSLSSTS